MNFHHLIRDSLYSLGLAVVALVLGLGSNLLRAKPLPLQYDPKAELLAAISQNPTAMSGVQIVGLDRAKAFFESKEGLILDARPDLFYEFGHIDGALNLSRKNFDVDREKLASLLQSVIDQQAAVMLYCADRHCPDAGVVAQKLIGEGVKAVLVFEGGWKDWEEAGLPRKEGA